MSMSNMRGSHFGAFLSYTEFGPPDRMMPSGCISCSCSSVVSGATRMA